jgi:hypothetical protein
MRAVKVLGMVLGISVATTALAQDDNCRREWLAEPSLKLRNLGRPERNDSLRLRGIVVAPYWWDPFDPAASGLNVLVFRDLGATWETIVDVVAPGGTGWTASADGRAWTFRTTDQATHGITRAVLREISPNIAYDGYYPQQSRQYALTVDARGGTYGATSDLRWHVVQVYFDTDEPNQCSFVPLAPWLYTGVLGFDPYEASEWEATCRLRSNGHTLACKSGRRVGPCRVSDPTHLIRCDVQRAAAAQAQYFAGMGSYYSGSCDGLPGFEPSPNVVCDADGSALFFRISAWHFGMRLVSGCTWDSTASEPLSCQ